MSYKLAKNFLYGLVGLVLVMALTVGLSSYLSLDSTFAHTNQSEALPAYSETALYPETTLVRIQANGLEFRARVSGAEDSLGTVIMLHGFPVTSAMWLPLIPSLTDAGYRVIAFDQRGYSPGARPDEQELYGLPYLVSDVLAVADAVGAAKFHLMGHDWGSAVGWATVLAHPDRILSWTGLSIPHPIAFSDALENDPDQQSRSRYFSLFTTPMVPELLFSFNKQVLLRSAYEGMAPAAIEEFTGVFAEPRALSSALNWYRAMGSRRDAAAAGAETSVPTLFFWGNLDSVVARGSINGQAQYMIGPYKEIELDGDHWLLSSHASSITPEVLAHIGNNR